MKKLKNSGVNINEIFMGIDVHKAFWVVSAVFQDEFILNSVRIPGNIPCLMKLISKFPNIPCKKIHIVYEAGFFGSWICHDLTAAGYDCIITAPTLIPILSGQHVKTDKRDSRKLALFLSKGLLKGIHVHSDEELRNRELIRTRKQLVCHRTDIERQIKSKLMVFGIPLPAHKGSWGPKLIEAIQNSLPEGYLKTAVDSLLTARAVIQKETRELDKNIAALAKNPVYKESADLLQTIPGIGTLSSMIILLELGTDMKRFRNSRKIAAYIGLTPAEYSSGEHIRKGNITRSGNTHLRAILVECCWHLIRKDPHMRSVYEKIKNRSGGKKAIVAIARKLTIRIRQVLLQKKPYAIAA